jgi:hypothetical protein
MYLMLDHSGQPIVCPYLVVAKVRERLAVNKQRLRGLHVERFDLETLNKVEDKVQYHVEASDRFAAFEDWQAAVDFNSAWETIRISKFQPERI